MPGSFSVGSELIVLMFIFNNLLYVGTGFAAHFVLKYAKEKYE